MQTLEDIKNSIPDFAKDIRLNFSSVIINSSHEYDLVYGCAYACSLSLDNVTIAKIFENECRSKISDDFVRSVKSIVSIMTMNNTWYKYRDAMPSMEMKVGPQKLRVNVMGTYAGLDKLLFESISLCISTVNNCQFCVKAHSQLLIDEGMTKDYVLEIGRIASVMVSAEKSIGMNEKV